MDKQQIKKINENNLRIQQQSQQQQKKGCTCSLNGCAWIILMAILMGICIQECQRSKLRLEREQKAFEIMKTKQVKDTLELQK